MKITILALTLILVSCGHHKDVRPGSSGLHRVVVYTDSSDQGQRDAIKQANHYCDQYKKSAAFESEKATYTGDVDETTYKRAKMASRAAKSVGGTTWAMGGKRESNVGGIAGLGGVGIDSALGKGYTIEMSFKCI